MALSSIYSRIHSALREAARKHGITPFAARLLLAVDELAVDATTDVLEEVLHEPNGSMIRRELQHLYAKGLAQGEAVTGGPPKRGTRTRIILTESGFGLVRAVQRQVLEGTAAEAAA